MKDLPFGPTTPHPVTEFQIKEELDRIERKIVAPIIILEIPVFEELMLFDIEMGAIFVNLPMTVEEINRALSYAPDADWRVLLGKIVDHELAHKNQIDFLLNHGISIEQQNYLHYRYLKEFQASYAVPEPVRNQCVSN